MFNESYDYKKWRKLIFRDCLIFCIVVLFLETVTMVGYVIGDLLDESYISYAIRNLITPTVFNFSILLIFYLMCKKSRINDDVKNNLAILSMSITASFTTIIHNYYSQITLCLMIPLFLSTVFGDKKILNRLSILMPIACIVAYILCLLSDGADKTSITIEYVISFFILTCTILASRVVLKSTVEKIQKVTEYSRRNEKFNELIKLDSLTGLYNNQAIKSQIEVNILSNDVNDFYLAMIDIDNFKMINDNYGHIIGDEILCKLSDVIKEYTANHNGCIGSRYGGEEFAIIFNNSSKAEVMDILEKIKLSFFNNVNEYKVTFSCGVTKYILGDSVSSFIEKSDNVLYYVKSHGKNAVLYKENN